MQRKTSCDSDSNTVRARAFFSPHPSLQNTTGPLAAPLSGLWRLLLEPKHVCLLLLRRDVLCRSGGNFLKFGKTTLVVSLFLQTYQILTDLGVKKKLGIIRQVISNERCCRTASWGIKLDVNEGIKFRIS